MENFWFVLIILVWTIPWKGVALWRAAKNNQQIWFIFFLLVNTLAVLEILYIFIFSHRRKKKFFTKSF